MNNIFQAIILVILCNAIYAQNSDFCSYYPKNCKFINEFYKQNIHLFNKECAKYKLDPDFLFAIVAPEIAKYNDITDKFETKSLETFYVNFGKEYANFSIGYFQMKPSFIEELEVHININPQLKSKFGNLLFHKNQSLKEQRKTRIDRLKQLKWQIKYLVCFYNTIQLKTKYMKFNTKSEKLKYYAAIYNCGISIPLTEIKKQFIYNNFPNYSFNKNFNYSDVALMFYMKNKWKKQK